MQRVQKVPQLRARGDAHAPQRGLVQRGFEVMQALAQATAIEGRGADRAATGGRIGRVAVKVGDGVAVDELQCGLAAEEIHHARAVVQKAEGAGFVGASAAAAGLVALVVLYVGVTFVQVWAASRDDGARKADAIVVLGAGVRDDGSASDAMRHRVNHAVRLWKEGFAPFIAMTGGADPGEPSEGKVAADLALSLGASGLQTFFRVTLPNIKWGLLYGVILCNARAMGEFGAVYVVSQLSTGERRALKVMRAGLDDPASRARFDREARIFRNRERRLVDEHDVHGA